MYIDPVYPDKASDARLLDVNRERKRLREIVTDGEWQGRDVSTEKKQLALLTLEIKEGRLYIPLF